MNQEIQPVLSSTTGTEHELGDKINFDTAMKIINHARNNVIPDGCCFKYLLIHFDYVAQTNYYAPAKSSEIGTLRIKPNFAHESCMKCCQNCAPSTISPKEKTDTCAKNIQYGRCLDDFMQHIVGSVLFREHYTKKK